MSLPHASAVRLWVRQWWQGVVKEANHTMNREYCQRWHTILAYSDVKDFRKGARLESIGPRQHGHVRDLRPQYYAAGYCKHMVVWARKGHGQEHQAGACYLSSGSVTQELHSATLVSNYKLPLYRCWQAYRGEMHFETFVI